MKAPSPPAILIIATLAAGLGACIFIGVSIETGMRDECAARAADLKTDFRWDRPRGCRLRRGDVYVPAHLAELAAAGITEIRQ